MVNVLNAYCINDEEQNIGDLATSLAIRQQLEKGFSRKNKTLEKFYETDLRSFRGEVSGATHTFSQLKNLIADSDLVVIGGGGLYSRSFFPLDKNYLDLLNDKPVIIYGLGYNRNLDFEKLSEEQVQSIYDLNQITSLSSVRDLNTKEFLAKTGVDSVCIGDPAIFLDESQLKSKKENSILRVGINAAYHGWTNQENYFSNIISSYVSLMNDLPNYLGEEIEFVYLKHANDENLIINELKKSNEFDVIDLEYTKESASLLKSNYSNLDCFVGMMLHSTIFAFGNLIPIYNIGYDVKNIAFMKLIDQEKYHQSYQDLNPDLIVKKVSNLLKDRYNIKKELELRYNFLKNEKEQFILDIVKL